MNNNTAERPLLAESMATTMSRHKMAKAAQAAVFHFVPKSLVFSTRPIPASLFTLQFNKLVSRWSPRNPDGPIRNHEASCTYEVRSMFSA